MLDLSFYRGIGGSLSGLLWFLLGFLFLPSRFVKTSYATRRRGFGGGGDDWSVHDTVTEFSNVLARGGMGGVIPK